MVAQADAVQAPVSVDRARPPRTRPSPQTHPLVWWSWAGAVALALTRVGNPAVLGLVIAGVITVAALCRRTGDGDGLFTRTLEGGIVLGVFIVLVRTGFYILVGLPDSSPVLLHLPSVDLPWFTNLVLLGPLHTGGLVHALIEGTRLAGLVITFGAASALANPRRALRHLPSSLHHIGTAAVIAVAGAPQLVASASRVRRATRLRAGAPTSKVTGLLSTLIPVLSGALDQALTLAGSMDSRGYARATRSSRGVGASLVVALLAGAAGTYGLLDASTPPAAGLGLLVGGLTIAVLAGVVASRSVRRTRYFRTPWTWREHVITLGALAIAVGTMVGTWSPGPLGAWRYPAPWPGIPGTGALVLAGLLLPLLTRRSA